MKKTALIVIFLSILNGISAQTSPEVPKKVTYSPNALEFSAGYSLVFGNYGAFNAGNSKCGYAANGYQVQIGFDWMGKKNLGLAFQYTFQRSNLKDTASHIIPSGMMFDVGPGYWSNHFLLFGPVYLKTIKKLHLDIKVLGGFVISLCPVFNTLNITDTANFHEDQNTGTGFAYQVSAGVGYNISRHLAFKFNLSLLGGWPVGRKQYNYGPRWILATDPITGIKYYYAEDAKVKYEIPKTISTLNPSIGLVYRF